MAKDPEEDSIKENKGDSNDQANTNKQAESNKIDNDPTKINLNKDMINVPSNFWIYLKHLFSIKDDVHKKGAEEEIRENITFSGINVWVLICSIIVASVGLMSNSIPVVIGAMLISPLMGPIRGIGLGAGIYDFKLVVDSLKNFGVMIIISILASFLFFLATPYQEITPELLARTHPDFRDVLIAFFGGLAGVIAASKGKLEAVVSGVAIATALMPPLCTAGFALSIKEWDFFFGAFYLFLLNSIFICLSTYLFVRYLKFPIVSYVNKRVEKKVRLYTILFIVLLIVPAGYSFYKVTLQGNFNKKAQKYIENVINTSEYKVEAKYEFGYGSKKSKIEIVPILGGATEIPEAIVVHWRNQLEVYDLDTTEVDFIVFEELNRNVGSEHLEKYSDLSEKSLEIIGAKDVEISRLGVENAKMKIKLDELQRRNFKVNYLDRSLKLDYPELETFIISYGISFNNGTPDTLYTFVPVWRQGLADSTQSKLNLKLENRIRFEIHDRIGGANDSILFIDKVNY
jgi:uncharacterized hydrophobic protein (TIGR00271 family)